MAELPQAEGLVDWRGRCVALEGQLLRFRAQASKIRELLAEKMQQLEAQVLEAECRAQRAERQVQAMEERLKAADMQTGEAESRLSRRCQDLEALLQEKEEALQTLGQQLREQKQMRKQEAKTVEEKAAKIKAWVTVKLNELELENQNLRLINQRQTAELGAMQWRPPEAIAEECQAASAPSTLQGQHLSGLCPRAQSPSWAARASEVSPAPAEGPEPPGAARTAFPQALLPETSKVGQRPEASGSLLTSPMASGVSAETESAHRGGRDPGDKAGDWSSEDEDEGSQEGSPSRLASTWSSQTSGEGTRGSDPSPTASDDSSSMCEEEAGGRPRRLLCWQREARCQERVGLQVSKLRPLGTSGMLRGPGDGSTSSEAAGHLGPLARRPLSQPQPGSDRSWGAHRNALSLIRPLRPQETDLDLLDMVSGDLDHPLTQDCQDPEPSGRGDSAQPPTPPLHRFPSWENRIYSVARSGIRMSGVLASDSTDSGSEALDAAGTTGPYTALIYRDVTAPVYTTIKGRAAQVSCSPCLDESSGSEEEGTHASEPHMDAPPTLTPGPSLSSLSSDGDYAVPPDACGPEPEQSGQPQCGVTLGDSGRQGPPGKCGYLLKRSGTQAWRRRWFILRGTELLYYKSPSDVTRRPQGHVELTAACRLLQGDKQIIQLATEKHTLCLGADSPRLLEDWIRALQAALHSQAHGPLCARPTGKPAMQGQLTKVKHGRPESVWCTLVGRTLYYFRSREDKVPLGQIKLGEARVEEVDRSCDSDAKDVEASGPGPLVLQHAVGVHPPGQGPTYLLVGSRPEKDTWLYHLTVASGGGGGSHVGSEFEQLVCKLMSIGGEPASQIWRHPALCHSKEGIVSPLTTLPSQALRTEAIKLFKCPFADLPHPRVV